MSSKVYDVLKFVATIVLPAFGALYLALAGTWGLPYGDQIVATSSAIAAFMSALLMIDSSTYHKNLAAAQKNLGDTRVED